ncbi:MAG: glycosyltransferase family 2 protein [Candidatus Nezhaarchaeales archaeon]
MEIASILSLTLLLVIAITELVYLGYHVCIASASSRYLSPKGYISSAPVVAFHIPIRGESPALLERVLASIRQQRYPRDKIKVVIVCDDQDPKPMEEVCNRARRDLEVIFIHRRTATGFKAGALNEALKVQSDVIVVLDVDSVLPSDFLMKVLTTLYESNDVAAVVARWEPLNLRESAVSEAIGFGQKFFTNGLFKGLQVIFGSSILLGNACAIRRNALLRVGMWDEKCLLEDVELGVRLRLKGYRIVYNSDVPVWVEHPSTYSDFKRQQKRWAYGISQVLLKHGKAIIKSNLRMLEKVSLLIYLTQYWGLALAGLSIIALPLLTFFNGEPSLLPMLPLMTIGAVITMIYSFNFMRHTIEECNLSRRIKLLGRSAALALAMSFDLFLSSLKPLFKVPCTWRVTPKGPLKKTSKAVPKLELGLSILPLSALVVAMLKSYVVLSLWSLACLAPLIYVTLKRFG